MDAVSLGLLREKFETDVDMFDIFGGNSQFLGPGFQSTFGGEGKGVGVCRSLVVFEVVHEGTCVLFCGPRASGW